jgi:hypothetical protein
MSRQSDDHVDVSADGEIPDAEGATSDGNRNRTGRGAASTAEGGARGGQRWDGSPTNGRGGDDRPIGATDGVAESGRGEEAALTRRVERLEAENSRLRRAYGQAIETTHRRTAIGFGLIGAVAAVAALLVPAARDVLVALAGTGLFAAVLTLYLSPERFVAADVGERVYAAQARNHERLVAELGVSDHRLYLPATGDRVATLFVPQFDDYTLPVGSLDETLVVPEDERARGLAFTPTGGALFRSFERTLGGSLAERPEPLVDQLTEALAASFEVVDATEVDVAPDGSGADVAVYGSVFGDGTRFDDPVVSLLAVGLAVALDRPVEVTVDEGAASDEDGYVASFRWRRDGDGSGSVDEAAASTASGE